MKAVISLRTVRVMDGSEHKYLRVQLVPNSRGFKNLRDDVVQELGISFRNKVDFIDRWAKLGKHIIESGFLEDGIPM